MSDFVLSCCSTADLSKEHFEAINVKYICFHYELDGVTYLDDLGQSIPFDEFYAKMAAGAETKATVDKMEELADDGLDYSGKCYMCQSACMDDAKEVARQIEERFPKLNGKVEINNIGTTIGSHTGPGTVSIFFWGKKRID